MICNKDGCITDCRVKSTEPEGRDGLVYDKQIYWCVKHGDRFSILRKEGYEDIVEEINERG